MSDKAASHYESKAKVFSEISSIGVFILGAVVLIGWLLNIPALKSVLPGIVTMKANTALSFLLMGISLWFSQIRRADSASASLIAKSCAALVVSIGALTLCEYLFSVDIGIDQLIFKEDPGALFTIYPGRMAMTTAINFIILGTYLMLLNVKIRRVYYPLQLFTFMAMGTSLLAIAGYFYGVSAFYGRISSYTAMALHTCIAFVIVSGAILVARPDRGLAGILVDKGTAGTVTRRLLPVAVIVPLFLGWLKLYGEAAGLFNNEFGAAVVAVGNLMIMTFFILRSSIMIRRFESARDISDDKAKEAGREWEKTFDSMPDTILVLSADQTIRLANKSFLEMFKVKPKDVIGKKCYEIFHDMGKPWPECPIGDTIKTLATHTKEVNDPKIGIPLLVTTTPILDESGKITEIIHIARDISRIKNIEKELGAKVESLEKFQTFTVGRELKMKELKLRISELEARLNTKPQ